MARSKKEAFRLMYELDEEQEMFRDTIADYVKDKVIPRREELDREHKFPKWFYNDMVEMGITSLIIPEEYDGLGFGLFDVAIVVEEIAVGCAGSATSLGATFLGTDPILYFGTEEQKKKYLPRVVAGEVAAFSLTEPNAGSDAGGIKTIAERQEDGSYVLRGQKTYVTNGGVASIYTTFALTDKTRGARGVSGFIFEVDPDNPPAEVQFPKKFDKMGINASETCEIIFDGFDNLPEKRFRLVLEKDDQRFPAEDYKISGDSSDGFMKAERDLYSGDLSSRMSIRLEAGTWKATLLFNRLGSLQREFVVKDGALTTIEFRPEFTDSGKGVALSGTLRRVDGSPVANVEVEFLCKDVPGIEEDYIEWVRSIFEQGLVTDDMFDAELVEALRSGKLTGINEDQVSANSKEFQLMVAISNAINSLYIPGNPLKMETHHTTVTDAAGRFFVRSIRPGRWSVIVRRNRAWIDLPDLVLPDKIQGAHEITLTMPDNTVTGRIGNSAAVLDMVHSLHFSIIDSDGEQVFMDSPGKEGSDPFRLEGIPDGTHRLLIHATDFMDFESAPFELSGGQSLDLGTIHMRPCGVIHLKAVDAGGTEIRYYGATSLSTGRELRHVGFNDDFQVYTNALLGQSIIRITADSYRDKDIVVDIEHGKPVELTVEMEAL